MILYFTPKFEDSRYTFGWSEVPQPGAYIIQVDESKFFNDIDREDNISEVRQMVIKDYKEGCLGCRDQVTIINPYKRNWYKLKKVKKKL